MQDPLSCAGGNNEGLRLALDMGVWEERRWQIAWEIYKGQEVVGERLEVVPSAVFMRKVWGIVEKHFGDQGGNG